MGSAYNRAAVEEYCADMLNQVASMLESIHHSSAASVRSVATSLRANETRLNSRTSDSYNSKSQIDVRNDIGSNANSKKHLRRTD